MAPQKSLGGGGRRAPRASSARPSMPSLRPRTLLSSEASLSLAAVAFLSTSWAELLLTPA
ncbi:hypothetical protein PG988_011154 [Apiospora saccharicola]